jgi:hypothetical protein
MPKLNILQEGQSYIFRSYFEMPYETDEILAALGYAFASRRLQLPIASRQSDRLPYLRQQIEEILPLVRLSSETARRETLVAPVLLEVARFGQCQIRIEYPLTVNNWLEGSLDYLLRRDNSLLVVEAKNDDLSRGFTQLAVELIALTQIENHAVWYGAVTMGDVWRFGTLETARNLVTQDITLYRVPDDLDHLTRILIGIVGPNASGED